MFLRNICTRNCCPVNSIFFYPTDKANTDFSSKIFIGALWTTTRKFYLIRHKSHSNHQSFSVFISQLLIFWAFWPDSNIVNKIKFPIITSALPACSCCSTPSWLFSKSHQWSGSARTFSFVPFPNRFAGCSFWRHPTSRADCFPTNR